MSCIIRCTDCSSKPPSSLLEVERLGDALTVRPVGAEEDSVDADELGESLEVLLEVGRAPDVPADGVERILGEDPRGLVGLLAQMLHEPVQPVGAVLDAGDPKRRMALNTPCTTSEAIESWIARPSLST